MNFPAPETHTVTEHTRETNQPIRQYEGQITLESVPIETTLLTVTFHERYRATYLAGGSGGEPPECPELDDGRPETGMLYPRG